MAAAFLSQPAAPPRLVVVGGEAIGRLGPSSVAAELREVAASLGVGVLDAASHDLARSHAEVCVWDLGALDESSLDHLSPPTGAHVDLLLWTLPGSGTPRLLSRYVLGLWAWALGPERVRCLAREGDKPKVSAAVSEGLQWADYRGPCEVIEVFAQPEATAPLCRQILLSVLSAPARAREAAD